MKAIRALGYCLSTISRSTVYKTNALTTRRTAATAALSLATVPFAAEAKQQQTKTMDPMPKQKIVDQFQSESCYGDGSATLTITVVGASGDLAKKMTFPAILDLYVNGFIPSNSIIIGYARSELSNDDLRKQLKPTLKDKMKEVECGEKKLNAFLKQIRYVRGSSGEDDMRNLMENIEGWENEAEGNEDAAHNRLFYFAIPPSVFLDTAASIKKVNGVSETGWTRLIVEKPFGRDYDSAKQLANDIGEYYPEEQIYRIDHYLGEEMVQNLMTMRFGNIMFEPIWNQNYIESVTFDFKEDFGTAGRGGYFDKYGIIRDIIQNHLLQVFCMVAMEPPVSVQGDDSGIHIRDAKVNVLRCVKPIDPEEVVLGQYTGNGDKPGYTEDEDVPDDSTTETFASLVLRVSNRRWDGVPFVFRAAKAVDESKVEVRIKFKEIPGACGMFNCDSTPRNELVLRLEPDEDIKLKLNIKEPGLETMPLQTDLSLSYRSKFPDTYKPDPYVRLLLEVLRGKQATFVRTDELLESWKIFTPLLDSIESSHKEGDERFPVNKYKFGSVPDFMAGPGTIQKSV